ncbi:hypothetical protein C475_03719 [Halosimplex carlsbadense 2-9-1]|uniref:DUF7827 domain-containing protein n=1 Tax=Halosimplex carlsbadense 2-9-1 TaxID=797114 RepID=M0D544_9EURY|nr:BGTF surface domain-containing protein [Halosimplex carlsbadense]ELZ29294.1 hypothetical protein C475_03719 [Halosimplex carlsbadense 2-9-1]
MTADGLVARVRGGVRPALLVFLVATLVTSPLAGVVAADAARSADSGPSFEESITTVRQGETAEIAVNTTGASGDGVQFVIGDADDEDQNFEAHATVTDADGDGTVVVRFDTAAVDEGSPESYLTVAGDDAIEDRTELAGTDDPLAPTAYDLALGDPADPVAIGTLALLSADGDSAGGADGDDGTATPRPLHDGTTVDTTDGEVVVDAGAGQTIAGETTLDPGTTLSIRVTSRSDKSPFLMQAETTVGDDGSFSAPFDFGNVPVGTALEVSVRGDGEALAEVYGRVADCEDSCPTATATPGPDGEGSTATPLDTDEIQVQSVAQVASGDTVRIPVTFGDADALTVTLGDERAVNYETSAVVRDTNGDGRAVVVVRTGAAADADRPVLAVAEAGETRPANVTSETTLDGSLDPFEYDVSVSAGTAADGEPDAIGTLVVLADDGSAGDDAPTATADDPPADPAGPNGATVAAEGGSGSPLAGLGALAVGGLIAFGGVATFLGFVRD